MRIGLKLDVQGFEAEVLRGAGNTLSHVWLLEQPQNNGVTDRFFKTLKEQFICGRVYRTVAELRAGVDTFVDLCSEQWLPEKNGFPQAHSDARSVVRSKGRRLRKIRFQRSGCGTSSTPHYGSSQWEPQTT